MVQLGADTFRGTASECSGFRSALYAKTQGDVGTAYSGLLMHVASPVTGFTLTAPAGSGAQHHGAVRDPITGTILKLGGPQVSPLWCDEAGGLLHLWATCRE